MIYLYDGMQKIPDGILNETYPLMPPERRRRADRYRRHRDRDMCVMAYWLLLHGLRREYGIMSAPALGYGENGKPYLPGHPGIFFNLSHCVAGIVCALSSREELGADIETVRPYKPELARRICSGYELAQLENSTEPERLFCRIWTIKESFIKKWSESIFRSLDGIDSYQVYERAGKNAVCLWGDGYHLCCLGESEVVRL